MTTTTNVLVTTPVHRQTIDGHVLAYREVGDRMNPALVLIHGWMADSAVWRFLPDASLAPYRVIAVDLLGHGGSDKPRDADYSIEAQARRVLKLLDYLKIDRFHLMGHSMGGQVAQMIAARLAPDRVIRLVDLSGVTTGKLTPRAHANRPQMRIIYLFPFLQPLLAGAVQIPAIGRVVFKEWFHIMPPWETWRNERQLFALPGAANAAWPCQVALEQCDLTPELHNISAPTLVIFGRQDGTVLPSNGETVAQHVPNSRMVWIENCGHFPMIEAHAQTIAAINAFLAGTS